MNTERFYIEDSKMYYNYWYPRMVKLINNNGVIGTFQNLGDHVSYGVERAYDFNLHSEAEVYKEVLDCVRDAIGDLYI